MFKIFPPKFTRSHFLPYERTGVVPHLPCGNTDIKRVMELIDYYYPCNISVELSTPFSCIYDCRVDHL